MILLLATGSRNPALWVIQKNEHKSPGGEREKMLQLFEYRKGAEFPSVQR
jgi:hypothetical protein